MRDQRVKFDRCVNMCKVKKEDLEQYEKKEAALLGPPAKGAICRDRLPRIMFLSYVIVNSCKQLKNRWRKLGVSFKRSASSLNNTNGDVLVNLDDLSWTVYKMATSGSPGRNADT